MVNLLFISNSAKIETIKNDLQPLLKVKIDIVGDFDYGLKDVFEKRPAMVFIQDQIAGVTGESVARHIQMLLGSAAPSFIFMHDGSPKIMPIKGLFEYLIDLSQSDVKIVEDIQATLKSLLGPQWEKIYIPPKNDTAAIRNGVAEPKAGSAFADKLVDDFLSDLDNSGSDSAVIKFQTTDFAELLTPADDPDATFLIVSSPQDQLAEMSFEISKDLKNTETPSVATNNGSTTKPPVTAPLTVSTKQDQPVPLLKRSESALSVAAPASVALNFPGTAEVPSVSRPVSEVKAPGPSSPANFIIAGDRSSQDIAPDDLLRAFEANYYSRSNGWWKRFAVVAIVLTIFVGAGAWLILKQKPDLLMVKSKPAAQLLVVTPAVQPQYSGNSLQKPAPPPPVRGGLTTLPSFIPQAGLDRSFASQKPGWERYVDTEIEFRVYRLDGTIKAIQALAKKNHDISEPKLKSILIEMVGDGEYRVKSSEQKFGYHVSRSAVGQNAELLIYRKKTAIRAFVVSLD
jgi:flagellar FliL protein